MEEKVYGEYPGFLSKEGIDIVSNGNELDLYMTINSIGHFIWRMNHDAADGRLDLKLEQLHDLMEAQYAIEYAVLQTKRFGVDVSKDPDSDHVKTSDGYFKWLEAWNNYIQYELPESEYDNLMSLMKSNGDYSMYRPKNLPSQEKVEPTGNVKINEDDDGTFTL
jgi:hypothetical protein